MLSGRTEGREKTKTDRHTEKVDKTLRSIRTSDIRHRKCLVLSKRWGNTAPPETEGRTQSTPAVFKQAAVTSNTSCTLQTVTRCQKHTAMVPHLFSTSPPKLKLPLTSLLWYLNQIAMMEKPLLENREKRLRHLYPLFVRVLCWGPCIFVVVESWALWGPAWVVLGRGHDLVRCYLSRFHSQRVAAVKVWGEWIRCVSEIKSTKGTKMYPGLLSMSPGIRARLWGGGHHTTGTQHRWLEKNSASETPQ